MVSELIDKYIWLLQTLIDAGEKGLTLEEIETKWRRRYNADYPRRTFNNHRQNVADIFGVEILCNRSTNTYYIESAENAIDQKSSVDWLVNTFTVSSLLSLGKERLSGRVSVEDIPSGHRYLTSVMGAMQDNRELEISYSKYGSAGAETLHVLPYAVKEYEKRWYLIGFCKERDGLRVYGLDRVCNMELTGETFKMPKDFDVDRLFDYSFGIYFPSAEPVLIKFRADKIEASYLKDLPIHHTQSVISEDADHTVFAIRVIPDKNLYMEFCRRCESVEVLEPLAVRQAVRERLEKANNLYNKIC